MENLFFGMDETKVIILFTLLIARIKLIANGNIITVSLVNLVGTFLHELAHFVVGLLLMARPVSFSIFPKKTEGGYTLGTVSFTNLTWWNTAPVAMAPLLLLGAAYYFDSIYYGMIFHGEHSLIIHAGYLFGLAILIDNAIPSSVDFKAAFGSVLIPILVLGVIGTWIIFSGQAGNVLEKIDQVKSEKMNYKMIESEK